MKALIYDPYIDTLGGGERYTFFVAKVLLDLGYKVEFAWGNKQDILKAQDRFNFNLSSVTINQQGQALLASKGNLLQKFFFTRQYNLIFYLSDGSLPFLFARQNFIHIQTPFKRLGGNKILNKAKLSLVDKIIYNSIFTRNVVEKNLNSGKDHILYPPIDTSQFKTAAKKENIILSVGRFDSPSHSKRQDVLIDVFAKLKNKNYKLVLAGGVKGEQGLAQVEQLKKTAQGLNVEFALNIDFNRLKQLYAKAKIFWHAAGYKVDEVKHPDKVEHFGMTTVEAMSAGVVPIVISRGGQKEIITSKTGFLSNTIDEMASSTLKLIADEKLAKSMSLQSIKVAKQFSQKNFAAKLTKLLSRP